MNLNFNFKYLKMIFYVHKQKRQNILESNII